MKKKKFSNINFEKCNKQDLSFEQQHMAYLTYNKSHSKSGSKTLSEFLNIHFTLFEKHLQ